MMRYLLLACLLPVALVTVATSTPESISLDFTASGNNYLRMCGETGDHLYIAGVCLGYANGLIDGLIADSRFVQLYCPPDGVTMEQEQRILLTFIKQHPELSQKRTRDLAINAAIATFPCPQAKVPGTTPNDDEDHHHERQQK